jgi:hypothetical protein
VNLHTAANPNGHLRGVILPTGGPLDVTAFPLAAVAGTDSGAGGSVIASYRGATRALDVTVMHTLGNAATSVVVDTLPDATPISQFVGGILKFTTRTFTDPEAAALVDARVRVRVNSGAHPNGELAGTVRRSPDAPTGTGGAGGGAASTDSTTEVTETKKKSDGTAVGFAVVAWLAIGAIGAVAAAIWWRGRQAAGDAKPSTAYQIGAPATAPAAGGGGADAPPPPPPRDNQYDHHQQGQQQQQQQQQQNVYAAQPPPPPRPAAPAAAAQPPPPPSPAAAAASPSKPKPPPKPVDF